MLPVFIFSFFSLTAQSVGLVLSGGGAKGLSHIGVIKVLELLAVLVQVRKVKVAVLIVARKVSLPIIFLTQKRLHYLSMV